VGRNDMRSWGLFDSAQDMLGAINCLVVILFNISTARI
jgi:hypothetical protein